MRLCHALEFERVRSGKLRKNRGPVLASATPNDLGAPRLGLAIGKRVGNAVIRNSMKRRLREAFRATRSQMTDEGIGLDLVLSVRPHDPLSSEEYSACVLDAARALAREQDKRTRRAARRSDG